MSRKIIAYGLVLATLSLLPGQVFAAGQVQAGCKESAVKAKTSPDTTLPDVTRRVSLV